MRNILIMILFASFFSLPFSACRRREEKVEKGVEISTAVASREIAAPVISAFGSIVYKAKADVYPTSTSNVKALFADKGMSVNKGDLLALLAGRCGDGPHARCLREGRVPAVRRAQ